MLYLYGYVFQTTPVKVMDEVVSVSAGTMCTAAIKSDGSLWTWGWNVNGQLGDGTTIDHNTPVKVLDDVASVSMGSFYAAAIKIDGSLWTWGQNSFGALGGGTGPGIQALPVRILDDVVSVSVGTSHTAAIKSDGSFWIWGDNSHGQLGNGGEGNAKTFPNSKHNLSDPFQNVPYCLPDFQAALPDFARSGESNNTTVAPSPCAVTLDGTPVTLNAYLFPGHGGGTNYVMLRDVAYLLNGTGAQFEVGWDKDTGILLNLGQAYTPTGGELQGKGDSAKPYMASTGTVTVDGMTITLEGYVIEGNNYFKLRDLGRLLGFGVGWDNSTGSVTISSNQM